MTASRCLLCGYRNGLAASVCINCGQALKTPEPVVLLVEPRAHTRARTERHASLPAQTKEAPLSALIVSQEKDDISPYQTALRDIVPFQSAMLMSTHVATPDTDLETREPLPFGFAWTRPALYGTVIQIEVREQIDTFPNIGGAMLAILAEVFWAILNVQGTRDASADRIEVTSLRVQALDKRTHDVSVRGSQRGAHLSMGDTVSLWGRRRKGNLIVRKGYDHTTRSRISTTALSAFVPALFILLVVGALYLYISHTSLIDALNDIKEIIPKIIAFLHAH